MNERQRRFALAYIEKADIKAAALTAGYSESYADRKAYLLLEKQEIKEYIAELMKKIESEKIAKSNEILQYLTSVMRGETNEEVVLTEGRGLGVSEAVSFTKPAGEKERLKAAELLGKRYCLFTDKVETSGDVTLNINVDYGDKQEQEQPKKEEKSKIGY